MITGEFSFIWINGPTNAGKNTLIKKLLEKYPNLLKQVISVKERAPRFWEQEWIDYIRYNRETFDEEIKNGKFIEYAEYPRENNTQYPREKPLYYGTRIKDVFDVRNNRFHVIKEMETLWMQMALKSEIQNNIIALFIDIPEEEIKKRMSERDGMINLNRINTAKLEKEEFMKLQQDRPDFKMINGLSSREVVFEEVLDFFRDMKII